MRFPKTARVVVGLLVAGLTVVSCTTDQSLTAPATSVPAASSSAAPVAGARPSDGLLGGVIGTVTKLTGSLLTCTPMPFASDSARIGPAGGTLHLGPHTFVIPRGALSTTLWIKGVVPRDTVNSVRFSPQGLQFNKPASLTMSYANCNLVAALVSPLLSPKRIAYTTNNLHILEYVPSSDNPLQRKVTGQIEHFSRYAVGY